MRTLLLPNVGNARQGSATVFALVVLFVIGGLVAVLSTVAHRQSVETTSLSEQDRAFYAAQAGVNEALARIEAGNTDWIGGPEEPVELAGVLYWVEVVDNGDATFTLTAHARAGREERSVEAVALQEIQGVYRNGIFAGNSSGDPTYTLELGGSGVQADEVHGDVYSGGSVALTGDAEVDGTIRATNSVSGADPAEAETGSKQYIPDIAGMNYAATADVMVAKEFVGATYKSNGAGGSAWQVPEASPAHIFRKNPSDRTAETLSTVKDDYFLEDPYEAVKSDSKSDGSNAYPITLSGVSGESGTSSNQKVFFIDGNLWIHNYKTMSMKFQHADSAGVQVTFVVQGNIYISDNLFYSNDQKDGVAFIAMKDAAVPNSGNIYFGDPQFGTLERMHAFLYAENNFYDVNLSATGSAVVELYGNMTAGNQVSIKRDHVTVKKGKKIVQHSKLMVDFDGRIAGGDLKMPGLPTTPVEGGAELDVISWREVGRP